MTNAFHQVAGDYRHKPKVLKPGPRIETAELCLKWHLLYPEALPITTEQVAEAQGFLRREVEAGRLAIRNQVGFVVQHRCAEVLILYVCTWRNDNEVWETLYHSRVDGGAGYALHRREDTSPTFCVWVLNAVGHEHKAWSRYLASSRDDAARVAYLADELSAVVT
jgi:hypothetical protein